MATKKNVASPEDEGLSTGAPAPEEAPTKEGEVPAPEEAPTEEAEVPAPEEAPTEEAEVPTPEEVPTKEGEVPAPEEAPTKEGEVPAPEEAPTKEAEAPAPEEAPTKEAEAPAPEEALTKEAEAPAPEEALTKEGKVPAPEEAPTKEAETPAPEEEHVEGTDTPEATPVAEERGAAEAEDNHEDTTPTDEEMPPTALSELARQILRDHDLRVVFLVSDGTAFYTYSDALNYAQTLTDSQVQYFFATPPTDEDLRELLPPALRPKHLKTNE